MKVIVAGGRDLPHTVEYRTWVISMLRSLQATEVVSGCASGADRLGEVVATELGLPIARFPALWALFGNQAGPMRNREMAKYADACLLLPGGRGTLSMKRYALSFGLQVLEYPEV